MTAARLITTTPHTLYAVHLVENLRLKKVAQGIDTPPHDIHAERLLYQLGKQQYCLVYNFGSLVFCNVPAEQRDHFLARVRAAIGASGEQPATTDEFVIEAQSYAVTQLQFEKLVVPELTTGIVEVMGLVLARSAALEFYEGVVGVLLKDLEAASAFAAGRQWRRISEKTVLALIDRSMRIKRQLIGSVALLEKPELTWDNKTLDELFEQATFMFELRDRFRSLDYQLKTVQEDLTLLASLSSSRQMLILEAAIVGLFILDIVLVGIELFFGLH